MNRERVGRSSMGNNGDAGGRLYFEDFELDLHTRELQVNGTKVILQEQPFQVLVALLEQAWGAGDA